MLSERLITLCFAALAYAGASLALSRPSAMGVPVGSGVLRRELVTSLTVGEDLPEWLRPAHILNTRYIIQVLRVDTGSVPAKVIKLESSSDGALDESEGVSMRGSEILSVKGLPVWIPFGVHFWPLPATIVGDVAHCFKCFNIPDLDRLPRSLFRSASSSCVSGLGDTEPMGAQLFARPHISKPLSPASPTQPTVAASTVLISLPQGIFRRVFMSPLTVRHCLPGSFSQVLNLGLWAHVPRVAADLIPAALKKGHAIRRMTHPEDVCHLGSAHMQSVIDNTTRNWLSLLIPGWGHPLPAPVSAYVASREKLLSGPLYSPPLPAHDLWLLTQQVYAKC